MIGHVGRFEEQKNHHFLLEVFAAASRTVPKLRLLLIGDGPLRPAIEKQVRALGLAERVVFAGVRADVPRLLCQVIDLVIFPSLYEGLGLVLIEAQAAGRHCLISDVIPAETDIIPECMHRLPLASGAAAWAEALLELPVRRNDLRQELALERVRQSAFNIEQSVSSLLSFYVETLTQAKVIVP